MKLQGFEGVLVAVCFQPCKLALAHGLPSSGSTTIGWVEEWTGSSSWTSSMIGRGKACWYWPGYVCG